MSIHDEWLCLVPALGPPAKLPRSLLQAKGLTFICVLLLGAFDSFHFRHMLSELELTSGLLFEQMATLTSIKWGEGNYSVILRESLINFLVVLNNDTAVSPKDPWPSLGLVGLPPESSQHAGGPCWGGRRETALWVQIPSHPSLLLLRGWAREGLGVPVPTMVLLPASSSPADSAGLLH